VDLFAFGSSLSSAIASCSQFQSPQVLTIVNEERSGIHIDIFFGRLKTRSLRPAPRRGAGRRSAAWTLAEPQLRRRSEAMKIIVISIVVAALVAAGAGLILSLAQEPAYEAYTLQSVRLDDPGYNLVGPDWSGDWRQ
jgi:hypothetical protein